MNRPIRLRAASPADVPFLFRLRMLTTTGHVQRAGLPTEDARHDQRILSNFEDAKIICEGFARVGLLKLRRAGDGWHVDQIQILPTHQRKGIGEAVLRAVLAAATREGVPVSVTVLQGNPARRLYERLGFRLVMETSLEATLRWHP